MSFTNSDITSFRKTVLGYYRKKRRKHLPWRKTKNPYHILVSEIMLQQTQVDRVIPYYKKFLKRFPTVRSLAESPLSDVLRVWQGLGYNRRAKYLRDAAQKITIYGNFSREYEKLILLPGVGEYTAKAVRVFAFNEPEVMLETNIRTAFIHRFFPRAKRKISDKEIFSYMKKFPYMKNPREWYAALMDYGAYLKKQVPNPGRKSAHHTRQKPFKGSDREIRGAILRAAAKPLILSRTVLDEMPFDKERVKKQLDNLIREGLIEKRGARYVLPS